MTFGQSKILKDDEIAIGCKPATFYTTSILCKLKEYGQIKVIVKDRPYLTSKDQQWSILKQWEIVWKILNDGAKIKIIDEKFNTDGTKIYLLEW